MDRADEHRESTVTLTGAGGVGGAGDPSVARVASADRFEPWDRYLVIERLGRGGVGEVWGAYDRQLERRVALKVLRQDRAAGPGDAARLLAEAQALARLSHPNVVTVHDVGVAADGRHFVAMEQVAGSTLDGWLAARPRPWREVARVLREVGRGLAAIHAAGLVHRDVKPGNVLVADDGRVLVSDLGLARPLAAVRAETARGIPWSPLSLLFGPPRTETGAVVGTPAYMAPEQLRGDVATPASDQHAFAVTFWEALHGARPARGEGGEPEPPASGTAAPGWLRRLLLRALSPRPASRFGSMDELLVALDRGLDRPRRALTAAAALAVGALFLLGVVPRGFGGGPALCSGGEERAAEVWNPRQAERLATAFRSVEAPFAASAAERVVQGLERWSAGWASAHREACTATRLRGEQSEELMDLRMACLDRQLGEVGALVALLGGADRDAVRAAPRAVASLPDVGACADAQALLARLARPAEPELAARLESIDARLTEGEALFLLGRFPEAAAVAEPAVAAAREVDHAPTVAAAALLAGAVALEQGETAFAEELFYEAWWSAQAGGDDATLAEAASELLWLTGQAGDLQAAERWGRFAEAALRRLGGDHDLESDLYGNWAAIDHLAGRSRRGLERVDRALALAEARATRPGADPLDRLDVASALNNRAAIRSDLSLHDAALDDLRRSLAIYEELLGPDHPDVLIGTSNLGVVLAQMARPAEAIAPLERTVASAERVMGAEHPFAATALANLASVLVAVGRVEEGLAHEEEALAIRRSLYAESDPHHPSLGIGHTNLGRFYRLLGRLEAAEASYRRAIEIFGGGPEALESARDDAGADARIAYPLTGLGQVLLARGESGAALPYLERALALREAGEVAPGARAESLFALAQALAARGDLEPAAAAARRALDDYRAEAAAAGGGHEEEIDQVGAWLAERAGRAAA